jgi:hypothetical protein
MILCFTRHNAAKELHMSLKCRMLKLRCLLHIKDYLFLFLCLFLTLFLCALLFFLSLVSFHFFLRLIFIVFSVSLYLIIVLFPHFCLLFLFRFTFTHFSPVLFYSFLSADIRKRIEISLQV